MNASKESTARTLLKLEESQALRILDVLQAAGLDFIVEITPLGWRVETEQRGNVEGVSCTGESLADALGQLTQVLVAELQVELDDDEEIPDERIPYSVEQPIAFCKAVEFDDPNDYRAYMSSELGGNFLEAIAE